MIPIAYPMEPDNSAVKKVLDSRGHTAKCAWVVAADGHRVQTGRMGFDVQVVVTLLKAPSEALMSELDHRFGEAAHTHGTKTVEIREHVSMPSEADAIAFVRALVEEAIPPGAKITHIAAAPA